MDPTSLLHHLATFQRSHELSQLSNLPESPQQTARSYLERELVKKGRVLLERCKDVQARRSDLEKEQTQITASLLRLKEEARYEVELPMGKTLMLDVSSEPLFTELWQDIEHLTGKTALYDTSLLVEESDELLSFL